MKKSYMYWILISTCICHIIATQDPFSLLGIPSLDPSQIFSDDVPTSFGYKSTDSINTYPPHNVKKEVPLIKSIEDLPAFLQSSNLSENEGLCVISRFLISDDFLLRKYGAIFDQTGFDGLMANEALYPVGTKERLGQRARSAAKVYYRNNYENNEFDAYGAEVVNDLGLSKGWKLFKVLMVGKATLKDHLFLKVCIPENEMMTALVSNSNGDCTDKVKYIMIIVRLNILKKQLEKMNLI
jgi:hypothetical protein